MTTIAAIAGSSGGAKKFSPGRKPGASIASKREPQTGDTIFASAGAFDRSRGEALT
jgi:hypothetical protein